MFKTMKQLFSSTNKDLRKRVYFTLGALMIFILGISIRVPGTSGISTPGFLELINTMGGGALQKSSIFALGVGPYITASIIIQLLQMDIIPYFAELSKQGPTGRQKLNQITRYVGIAFAFVEGYALSFALVSGSGAGPMDYLYIATVLTAGTAFLLWLGDQITQKGIGNGTSLIIMAGIVATLPDMFKSAFTGLVDLSGTTQLIALGAIKFLLFVIVYFAIVIGVIFIQESERRIPIQYANKSTNAFGSAAQSFMPIKLNTAGVIPVIFASSLLSIPTILAQVIKNETFIKFAQYLDYTTPVGFLLYVIFIFFFAYFYTFIQLKPEEFAKNLQDNGGYIPGIRPGDETKKYISKVLTRLTVLGATFLVVIAGLPILFQKFTSLPTSVSIGGTGLLIVVGVALETYKQLEGSILSRSYKKGYRR